MGIQLIDSDVPLKVEGVIVVIYGIPGIGKTSLAFTAEKPLLEDYDGGLQRAVKRKKAIRVDTWEDAVEFHNSGQLEELGIETLIIDTVGTMLDNYIAQAVIRSDAKNGKRDGSLGLSGYGAMKNVFNQFVNQMKSKKIDIIFIAHDSDTEEGGYNKKTLKVTGGSYDIIKSSADLIGFITMENNKRVLDFNPTDSYHGKNSAEFDKLYIPNYNSPEYDGYMANVIQKCKDKMNAMSEEMVEAQKKVEEYSQFINECTDLDELPMILENIDSGKLSRTYFVQVEKIYDDRLVTLFYEWVTNLKKPKEIEKAIEYAAAQDKKYASRLKGGINKALDNNGLTYDKVKKAVIPKTGAEAKESGGETKGTDAKKPDDKAVQTTIDQNNA